MSTMSNNNHKTTKRVKKTVTVELPITNKHGIADFSDFLNELQRLYNVEKNVKNNLYSFILENGMFKELQEYEMI